MAQSNFLPKLPTFSGEETGREVDDFIWEARMILHLQPLDDATASLWLISALAGRARQQIVRLPATEVDTPAKILTLLEENWGEQRDTTDLATAFFTRQQQSKETITVYASHLRYLWTKVNKAEDGMMQVPATILRDAFARGLQPAALRRDVRRFIRDHPDTTFEAAKKEAQRWLREDSDAGDSHNATVACLQAQLATLTAEVNSLRQQQQQFPMPAHRPHPPGPAHHPRRCAADRAPDPPHCVWCQRSGHTEDQCRHKQRYMKNARRQKADHQTPMAVNNQCVVTKHTGQSGSLPAAPAPNQRRRRRRRRRKRHSTTPDAVIPQVSPSPVLNLTQLRGSQRPPPAVTPTDLSQRSCHVNKVSDSDTDTDTDSGVCLFSPMPGPRTSALQAAPEPPPLPPAPTPRRSLRLTTKPVTWYTSGVPYVGQ
ncbi:uncharacterized protein LOC143295496 [Babylonia areolata]|uniref:uncharacterized protein LOC143295496 n=1 Tax=Babylonia areolata TaxID=304850 RepID=UPI003FCF85BD